MTWWKVGWGLGVLEPINQIDPPRGWLAKDAAAKAVRSGKSLKSGGD